MRMDKKKLARFKRHKRIRKKIFGTLEVPRLCVYRSNTSIYAQIIDDSEGKTLVAASSNEKNWRNGQKNRKNVEMARKVGLLIGQRALKKGIQKVVFDRAGYSFHGRVKALADGAREAGLKF